MDIDKLFQDSFEYHQKGDLEGAMEGYKTVLNNNPDHPSALHLSGLIEFDKNKNYDEAITLIEKSLTLAPNELQWTFNLGKVFSTAGKIDQAISTYKKALSMDPGSSIAKVELGDLYFKQNRLSDALLVYYRLLTEDIMNGELAQKYIKTLVAMSKSKEAEYFAYRFKKSNPQTTIEVK
ncbi:MAG: tetratricopeptide repeat protein [Desulfobacterales bacterium]|nr:tetratricopeptide repeat protein [Desulfobacterales bacterium]